MSNRMKLNMMPDLSPMLWTMPAQQDGALFALLLGRVGLAFLYAAITAVAMLVVPPFVERSVVAGAQVRYGGQMSERRQNTIGRLMIRLTRLSIFAIGAVAVLSLFVNSAGLFTFLGLFTAAMGFALRQIIGDYISGLVFLFEDLFVIGDEVQVAGERGTVEDVTMRTTLLRAPTGETRLVPNGDIRTVYNYSRAQDVEVVVRTSVAATEMAPALEALKALAPTLRKRIPELMAVPQVIVDEDTLGGTAPVAVRVRTRAGSEDAVRGQLMQAVQEQLTKNGVQIGDKSDRP